MRPRIDPRKKYDPERNLEYDRIREILANLPSVPDGVGRLRKRFAEYGREVNANEEPSTPRRFRNLLATIANRKLKEAD